MITYKQEILKKSRKQSFIGMAIFTVVILVFLLNYKTEYIFFLIPVIFLSNFFGGLKCPKCKGRMNAPSGFRGIEKVNYCSECGFDFNQDVSKSWVDLQNEENESNTVKLNQ